MHSHTPSDSLYQVKDNSCDWPVCKAEITLDWIICLNDLVELVKKQVVTMQDKKVTQMQLTIKSRFHQAVRICSVQFGKH